MQIMDERGTSTKVTKTEPLSLILVLNRLYGSLLGWEMSQSHENSNSGL